ncbi:unnamed protein product [Cuscuta europaea]|uniref:Uncharacterized protein n=1 Tax=Cuscuta europaea TaxID=41803 RepID=A0A9P1EBV4_CUSEU|nr:unnamed protein product [Cuscuta europaea]
MKKLRSCIEGLETRLQLVEGSLAEMKALVVAGFGKFYQNADVRPLFGDDEPVGEGSPPLDQGGSHSSVNPLSGEDEPVGEGSPPLDQGRSHTGVNSSFWRV